MRKLNKSELKRVYGAGHKGGAHTDFSGDADIDTSGGSGDGSGVSSNSPGGTSGDVSL